MTPASTPPVVARRRFLAGLAASGLVAAGRRKANAQSKSAAFFVAGYGVRSAYRGGQPVTEDSELARGLPSGYDGTVTMMTRVGPAAGETARALFPLRGHQILVSPDRATVLFVGMNDRGMVLADAGSLDLLVRAAPHDETALFGGHACTAADGGALFVAERRATDRPFSGRPDDHFGAITVRDPRSLAVIERFDSHGIAPHEVVLMADGRHLAVANYGSTAWPKDMAGAFPGLPHGVEPSVTIIDSRSGRLAAKVVGPDPRQEMRHLAALSGERITAVPVRPTTFDDGQRARSGLTEVYEPDRSDRLGRGYLPVPLLHISLSEGRGEVRPALADPPQLMQRGQSVVYDPLHDEALVTYPTSHTIVVADGRTGAIKRILRTDRLGLQWPRGIALHPDGVHYAVSGHWRDIFVFRRGTHALRREACRFVPLFGHSHLAAA